MNKKLLAVAIGSVLFVTGCTTGGHQHEPDSDNAAHSEDHGHMTQEHHDMMDKEMMKGHDHQQMMSDHKEMGGMGHDHGSENSLAGEPGHAQDVTRTFAVTADDTMRFIHEPFHVKAGETVKFVVTNTGALPHEFVINTQEEHVEHGKMMMNNPNMQHAPGGNAITLKPGATEELLWKFKNTGQIEAACTLPGHYQAGMHSPITVE